VFAESYLMIVISLKRFKKYFKLHTVAGFAIFILDRHFLKLIAGYDDFNF